MGGGGLRPITIPTCEKAGTVREATVTAATASLSFHYVLAFKVPTRYFSTIRCEEGIENFDTRLLSQAWLDKVKYILSNNWVTFRGGMNAVLLNDPRTP